MATGACGIDCDVCRLNVNGSCSSCGAGDSLQAAKKEAAQQRLFGQPCPILACARLNRHPYCLRDCRRFPCENFTGGPYPFSRAYLEMQTRRRASRPPVRAPYGERVEIPPAYWAELKGRSLESLCSDAGCAVAPPGALLLPVFDETLRVDLKDGCLQRSEAGTWQRVADPFLELLVLVYLLNVSPFPVKGELVSVNDLKNAHFFQGPHALKSEALLRRFGSRMDDFARTALALGGEPVDLADAAFRLTPFPKIPLHYLLWRGDAEFPASLAILFDRSIERHLSADAIWGVVSMTSQALLLGAGRAS